MDSYKTILVAVDLSDYSNATLKKVSKIAEKFQSTIHLVHVIEDYPVNIYAFVDQEVFAKEILNDVRRHLHKLGTKFNIAEQYQHIGRSSPKKVILELARQIKADLIVIGSHGKHGWMGMLGSTAVAVTNFSDRDVMVVHAEK